MATTCPPFKAAPPECTASRVPAMTTPFAGTERTAAWCPNSRHHATTHVKPPAVLKATAPKERNSILTQKRDDLKALITDVRAQIEAARAA